MFQEVLKPQSETNSDNGGGDEEAEQAAAMMHYNAAMSAVSFDDEELPAESSFEERMTRMRLNSDNSDDSQGGDSDAESYGRVEEPAP